MEVFLWVADQAKEGIVRAAALLASSCRSGHVTFEDRTYYRRSPTSLSPSSTPPPSTFRHFVACHRHLRITHATHNSLTLFLRHELRSFIHSYKSYNTAPTHVNTPWHRFFSCSILPWCLGSISTFIASRSFPDASTYSPLRIQYLVRHPLLVTQVHTQFRSSQCFFSAPPFFGTFLASHSWTVVRSRMRLPNSSR